MRALWVTGTTVLFILLALGYWAAHRGAAASVASDLANGLAGGDGHERADAPGSATVVSSSRLLEQEPLRGDPWVSVAGR